MIYWKDENYTYEENCKEFLSYMNCESEEFDFGEGLMEMGYEGGEHGMYRISILNYLNRFYEEEWKLEDRLNYYIKNMNKKERLNYKPLIDYDSKQLRIKLDDDEWEYIDDVDVEQHIYTKEQIKRKQNKYYRNRHHIKKKKWKSEYVLMGYPTPYGIVEDENKNEYLKMYGRGNTSRYLKNQASKAMRNSKYKLEYFPKGNKYKKTYDYWWELS